jgi:hypothetical protein
VVLQVRQFIDGAYQRTLTLLREKKDFVEAMAQVWFLGGVACFYVILRSWVANFWYGRRRTL